MMHLSLPHASYRILLAFSYYQVQRCHRSLSFTLMSSKDITISTNRLSPTKKKSGWSEHCPYSSSVEHVGLFRTQKTVCIRPCMYICAQQTYFRLKADSEI